MAADINTLLDASSKVLETVPEIYTDLAQSTAKQTGCFLARIPRAINAALAPIDIWITKREYSIEETKKLLQHKLQNVDPGKIVPPEPYVAVPAFQAISYCMDSDELREMYANLLANSMNSDKKDYVHPAYVEIIKQMSPLEAQNLRLFPMDSELPIAEYQLVCKANRGAIDIYATNVFLCNSQQTDIKKQAHSIAILYMLGLITIDYVACVTDLDVYDVFRETKEFIEQSSRIISDENYKYSEMQLIQGCVYLTPLGKAFVGICM